MRAFVFVPAFALVLLGAPSAFATNVCISTPASYTCAGEHSFEPDQPCYVTGVYTWFQTGTSAGLWGMGCTDGYRANGGGGTVANATGVGFWWPNTQCMQVWVANYLTYEWVIIPVCEAGEPPEDPGWGHLLP